MNIFFLSPFLKTNKNQTTKNRGLRAYVRGIMADTWLLMDSVSLLINVGSLLEATASARWSAMVSFGS